MPVYRIHCYSPSQIRGTLRLHRRPDRATRHAHELLRRPARYARLPRLRRSRSSCPMVASRGISRSPREHEGKGHLAPLSRSRPHRQRRRSSLRYRHPRPSLRSPPSIAHCQKTLPNAISLAVYKTVPGRVSTVTLHSRRRTVPKIPLASPSQGPSFPVFSTGKNTSTLSGQKRL